MNSLAEVAPPDIAVRKRHWLWPTRLRVYVGLVIAMAIWGWLDVRRRGEFEPSRWWEHKTDFTVYTEAGAAFFDGRDPYAVTNPRGWGYLYPPLFAILVSPLHELAPQNQVTIWFVVSVLFGWGSYREMLRIGRIVMPSDTPQGMFGSIPAWLVVLAVTVAMMPALNSLQRGQISLLKLYLLMLGFRLLIERRGFVRPLLGGMALALAIALKITPIIPAIVAIGQETVAAYFQRTKTSWLRSSPAALGGGGGLALWLLIVPALFVGWRTNLGHLETWWNAVAVRAENASEDDFAGNSTTVRNQSLTNAAYRLGNWTHYYFARGPLDDGPEQLRRGGEGLFMDAPLVAPALRIVRGLAGCMLFVVSIKLARANDRLGQAATFGLSCVATLVIFTIARGHYYVLMLPAVAFVPLWLRSQGRTATAIVSAAVPCALVIAHYAMLETAGRVGLLGLGTTLWYFWMCFALVRPARMTVSQPSALRRSDSVVLHQPLAA